MIVDIRDRYILCGWLYDCLCRRARSSARFWLHQRPLFGGLVDMTRLALPLTLAAAPALAEKAEAEKKTYESGWLEAEGIISDLQEQVEKAEAKRDEYHDIANAYAAWAGDILELLEERLGELDMDSPSDEALKRLMDRAEAGIASEVRHALLQDEGGKW